MRRVWLAASALALFAWAVATVSPRLYRPGEPTDTDVFHSGEMILHRIKYRAATDNYHMPLASVSAAVIINHSPPGAAEWWRRLSAACAFILVLALAVELGAPWLGLPAMLLLLLLAPRHFAGHLAESWHGHWGHLQAFFTGLTLLAAGLAVRHARRPGPATAWAAALALGATLLYRSTFVFLPPLLALFHWSGLKKKMTGDDRRTLVVLAVVPYLFLLPWIATGALLHGRFIPLEDGEAAPIIIGAVLGHVEKAWSRPPAELGLTNAGTAEVLVWAAKKIASDPAAYLLGYLRRLKFLFLINPVLFAAAALSFVLNRRKREFQVLALLCAYFVLTHACMTYLREYFDPLWPLLAVAGAAALPAPESAPTRKAVDGALGGFLAGALILCLFVYAALGAYAVGMTAGLKDEPRRLNAAIARHPGEAQFVFEKSMRLLETGSVADALPGLRAASALAPENPLMERMLIWAELERGDAARFKRWNAAPDEPALRAFGLMALGDVKAAGALWTELLVPPARLERLVLPPFADSLCARARTYPALRKACVARDLDRAEFGDVTPAEAARLRREAEALK